MLQVQRVHVESSVKSLAAFHPESATEIIASQFFYRDVILRSILFSVNRVFFPIPFNTVDLTPWHFELILCTL